MEFVVGAAIVLFIIYKIVSRKGGSKQEPDQYYVVQERQTQVKNHLVKVPGKKRKK